MASRSFISMIVSIRPTRKWLVPAVLALALASCGGDDEPSATTEQQATASEATTATSETQPTEVDPETETLPNDGDGTGTGENSEGGAGDEEAAQTLALFTGKDGAITPRKIRVPAFISIRVELRSGDGAEYALTFGDKTIEVPTALNSASTTFDGLRPGAKLVGKTSTGDEAIVEASAEPGP